MKNQMTSNETWGPWTHSTCGGLRQKIYVLGDWKDDLQKGGVSITQKPKSVPSDQANHDHLAH